MEKFLTKKKSVVMDFKDNNISEENSPQATNPVGTSLCSDIVSEEDLELNNALEMLKTAKLSHLKNSIQQIKFSRPFLSDDYRLLEVTEELADMIESKKELFPHSLVGGRDHPCSWAPTKGLGGLIFRGQIDDFPVLCTTSETYRVKEAETSNTLLILDSLNWNEINDRENYFKIRNVSAMKTRYLELTRLTVLSTRRIKEILCESQLKWNDSTTPNLKLYTFTDLLDIVQMSEEELRNCIENLPIVLLDGNVRLLSLEYIDRLLMELTDYIDDESEPDIQTYSIDYKIFFNALMRRSSKKDISIEAVKWLMKSHCSLIEGDRYMLNERAVCRSKASQLLRSAVKFDLLSFRKKLDQMLPDGVEMKDEYLEGLAFIDEDIAFGKTIRYLNAEEMPEDEYKRMELLFSLRSQWRPNEIRHFLNDICPTQRTLNEVLDKYCRYSMVGNERYLVGLK
ncbi:unnamed protein product [Dracunculus medinensis]|uniref:Sister chromatid cohesion protein DCC1 n=1 Tax=Dracunculus medinensis TaxID=318479 RepID=A0A0N4UDM2_DRAME|nr:unnamed protein product [Dracunculus medinensis]